MYHIKHLFVFEKQITLPNPNIYFGKTLLYGILVKKRK